MDDEKNGHNDDGIELLSFNNLMTHNEPLDESLASNPFEDQDFTKPTMLSNTVDASPPTKKTMMDMLNELSAIMLEEEAIVSHMKTPFSHIEKPPELKEQIQPKPLERDFTLHLIHAISATNSIALWTLRLIPISWQLWMNIMTLHIPTMRILPAWKLKWTSLRSSLSH